jgi:hypothetical protein
MIVFDSNLVSVASSLIAVGFLSLLDIKMGIIPIPLLNIKINRIRMSMYQF